MTTVKHKKRVFSGARATGRLHLGNYFGGVKGYIELQNNPEYECLYMAVDMHTITTPYNHKTLREDTNNIILDFLAAGLDPNKAVITIQSLVPEHTELAFLFSSVISVFRMQHLPTFKDKVKQYPSHVTMALLNYPVLMAADILAYKSDLVPAGLDQEPHLEVTREIARKMNDTYGTDFPLTQRFTTQGQYIPSLSGEGKMSKSVSGSYIALTDSLDEIRKKVRSIPTATTAGGQITGGIHTLFTLLKLLSPQDEYQFLQEYQAGTLKFVTLKDRVAEVIFEELQPFQCRRSELEQNPEYVERVIQQGAEKARGLASQTVREVKDKMGLRVGF